MMAWIPLDPNSPSEKSEPKVINMQEVRSRRVSQKLAAAHAVFRRWLGSGYDIDILDTVLSVAAANLLRGDPLWLMIVGGSGSGKTETAQSLAGCGAYIVSSISSEGALLSASPRRDVASDATGGLLNSIGAHGLLVIKDFTSILSMPERGSRPQVLAALREIHDGQWVRNVGSEGGRTLTWKGHLGIVGCCTTSWDVAHGAVASMGDRFVVVRLYNRNDELRLQAGRQAISNIGKEPDMRDEMKRVVEQLMRDIRPNTRVDNPPDVVFETLLRACNVASKARTPTEHDHRGRVTYSHDPESPTRLAKSLVQMIKGAMMLDITLADAFNLAMRCVRDSIPPIRIEVLEHMMDMKEYSTTSVSFGIQRPWSAVDRTLQALHSAGMLYMDKRVQDSMSEKPHSIYKLRSEDIGALYASATPADDPQI